MKRYRAGSIAGARGGEVGGAKEVRGRLSDG
jgi:hypothetical protein